MSLESPAVRGYLKVFFALWTFTAMTVGAALLDLGALSTPVALLIAGVKALLVLWFFMHLRYSNRLVWLFAGAGIVWLGLLIGGTVLEIETRGTHTVGGPLDPRESLPTDLE
jgi:cytochrome c oxidase subunit 4